jgi:hypothetical protein
MDSATELEPDEFFFQQGEDGTYLDGPGRVPSIAPVALELDFEPEPALDAERLAHADRFRRPVALIVTALGLLFVVALVSRRSRAVADASADFVSPSAVAVSAASVSAASVSAASVSAAVANVGAAPAPSAVALDLPPASPLFASPEPSTAEPAASDLLLAQCMSREPLLAPSAASAAADAPLAQPTVQVVETEVVRAAPPRPLINRPVTTRVSALRPRPASSPAVAKAMTPRLQAPVSPAPQAPGATPSARFPD